MRFDFYQTITNSGHIGYQYKTKQSHGIVTKNTFSGYHQKIAYCRKVEYTRMIYGLYFLSILFLYGGHLHIVNAKKEYTGFLKFFFRYSQLKQITRVINKKKPVFFYNTFPEKNNTLCKTVLLQKTRKLPLIKKIKKQGDKKEKDNKNEQKIKIEIKKYFFDSFQKKKLTEKTGFQKKSKKKILLVLKKNFNEKAKGSTKISRPSITYSETGIRKDSLSNWKHSLRFAKQYDFLQSRFHCLFRWNRKMFREYKELGDKSNGFFEVFSRNPRIISKKPDAIVFCNPDNNYGLVYANFRESLPLFGSVDVFTKRDSFDFSISGNSESSALFYKWNALIFGLYRYIRVRRFQKIFWYEKGSLIKNKNERGLILAPRKRWR